MANVQARETRWDDVRIFLAVYRKRTLAAAATRLGVDVSTVSRRLAALERDLGERLFERTRAGLEPAPAADRVLAAAEAMEAAHARLARDASDAERLAEGVVRVSTAPGVSSVFIAPALVRLRKRYPRLAIELDASVQPRDLTRHEADLAVRSVRSTGAELVQTHLVRAPWVVAAAPRLAKAKLASWGDLSWVQWDRDLASFPPARWIAQHVPAHAIALRTSDFPAQLAAARAGLGLILAPEPYVAASGLVPVTYAAGLDASAQAWPANDLWLVGHRALREVPRVAAVWSFLLDELRGGDAS
jgi:DNA-binding transcriptional LysR family regulator|nr:LysR family transcriptional regulator [Kofleriaceae bacterium]